MQVSNPSIRLTSSILWDKGPFSSNVCFALLHTAAEKQEAKDYEDAKKPQAQGIETASKTLTTRLTSAKDWHKLMVEQLGAILLSRNEKKPKGKAGMFESVVDCLGLPPVADEAPCSSHASAAPNVAKFSSSLPPLSLLSDMSFLSFPIARNPFACAMPSSSLSSSSSSPLPLFISMSVSNTNSDVLAYAVASLCHAPALGGLC